MSIVRMVIASVDLGRRTRADAISARAIVMLHWTPPTAVAFAGAGDIVATPGAPRVPEVPQRAFHARMLSHAATRRRNAMASLRDACRIDALYWKSCAPDAVAKARAVRQAGLAGLP